jgi:DNA-binding ferritin-like protein
VDLGQAVDNFKKHYYNKDDNMKKSIAPLIHKLFTARTQAHVFHLQTTSYATHKALDEFYSDIVDFIDELAETYQGKYGIITGYTYTEKMSEDQKDVLPYFEKLADYMQKDAKEYIDANDTQLQNILDEITALTNQTVYKLKFLK